MVRMVHSSERIRMCAELSARQTGAWEFFKTCWDRKNAEAFGESWGELFAEYTQKVVNDLQRGVTNALSVFMDNETRRVLADVPTLQVPALN